jgi:hypothetical protein
MLERQLYCSLDLIVLLPAYARLEAVLRGVEVLLVHYL